MRERPTGAREISVGAESDPGGEELSVSEETKGWIEGGKFDEVEAAWMASLEGDPAPVEDYLETARMLRKKGERTRSETLLDLLAEGLKEAGRWSERLRVLREIGRLSRHPSSLRQPLREAVEHSCSDRPSYARVIAAIDMSDEGENPVEQAEKIEMWLTYDEGGPFFMAGRGVGVVIELNPDLGITRLDFENEKRVAVPLGAAPKYLEPIGEDHLLRRKLTDPEGLTADVLGDPPQALEDLLRGFGRAMSASEIKDALVGVIPAKKWSSWWTAARKHPQVVMAGAGSRATYSWKDSAEAAEEAIRRKFDRASLREKMDVAKRQSGRNDALAADFAGSLVAAAEKVHQADPGTAWEVFALLEKLPGSWSTDLDPDSLLLEGSSARTISSISDRTLREKALEVIRQKHPDWQDVYADIFFLEDDPRVLAMLSTGLEEAGQQAIRDRLIDETLRFPRRHPSAFAWFCRLAQDAETLPERADYPMIFQLLELVGSEEGSGVRSRLRELFDKGALVYQVITNRDNMEQGARLFETIDRFGAVDAYRREFVKAAVLMKYPSLREPQQQVMIATSAAAKEKRAELEKLKTVEIPANLKAIQEAREHGDLRENFEYKAARQRQEYLTARVAALQNELSNVRVLEPAEIDPSEIRVGTRIVLRNGDLQREVTILGPWESNPEQGIYSHESDVAKAMVGKKPGEIVSFLGNDYIVESIHRWTS